MRFVIPFLILAATLPARGAPVSIHITTDRATVGEGRTVMLTAEARRGGQPAPGVVLHPYVDGRRWGAESRTNARGRARWPLPLPNSGTARIEVAVGPPAWKPDASWIWAPRTVDHQTLGLEKHFHLAAKPSAAKLYVTADDSFEAWVNGRMVMHGGDLSRVFKVVALERRLRPGDNTIFIRARNGQGPAGVVAKVVAQTTRGRVEVPTDATWRVSEEVPASFPPTLGGSTAAVEIAPMGQGPWPHVSGWPGYTPPARYVVGLPLPKDAVRSNSVAVRVTKRSFPQAPRDPEHLVGMEWEPWFTPRNIPFSTAEAIPLLGRYDSWNRDVARQHALWLVDAGVDFILVDWTNNLWGKEHWADREPAVDELVRGTTTMLETLAALRKEGVPVPRVALLPGLENGVKTTTAAVSEQNRWVADHYLKNPRYAGLWVDYEGKPLLVLFNGSGPRALEGQPPVRAPEFTLRWMASQLQGNHFEKFGYWSWMDGVLHPIPTYHNGRAEALTVTPAFFGDGGWTAPAAVARRGGATFAEQFRHARAIRPKFLLINQWNEFAGQPKGGGYGPKHDQYVDCYSVPLSDDIEPTSLDLRGYRGDLGYGFLYANLTRALVAWYHGGAPTDTILTVAAPERNAEARGSTLSVEWLAVGRSAASFTLELDGRTVARNVRGTHATIPLAGLKPGPHRVTVRANGATTHFPLSVTREDTPLGKPVPTAVRVPFTLQRPGV